MIAVAVTGEQREVVVAAPAYLEKNSVPQHPSELVKHTCIGWRPNPNVAPYRWEFEQDGQAFSVSVNPQITTNDLLLMIRTAVAGAGFTFAPEETFRPYIERGELVPVLTEYLPSFPGFYLYYPNRANLPPKLRALVDHVMSWKRRQ
jgi:DNA-binding transcriptional LysR family regulator